MPFDPREVRAQMARKDLTVEQLAALAGIGTTTITKALGPNGNPTVDTLEKMARGLGLADESVFFAPRPHCSVTLPA